MNLWAARGNPKYNEQEFHPYRNSRFAALPLSLFAVCRMVHDETTKIFYGENRFAVSRRAPRGLRILERFGESTLAEIKLLIVWINLESCDSLCCGHRERKCGNGYVHCSHPLSHDEPMSHTSISDQAIISQWQRICVKLSRSVLPGQLKLYIICDCEDLQTAKMITEPLTTLPMLRDAALRLRRDYDKQAQSLVENTVLRLTNRSSKLASPFRFLDLPKEIQLHILKYTDLVAETEITCNSDQMVYNIACPTGGAAISSTDPDTALLKCFCYSGHSAFTFRCHHYKRLGFPSAMFLVNRKIRDAATEVFYGSNSFVISRSSKTSRSTGSDISILPGLKRFPKYAIRFITTLRFEIDPSELRMFGPGAAPGENWLDTVDLLSKYSNLAVLNLEIRLAEELYALKQDTQVQTDTDYTNRMLDTYQKLVQPLAAPLGPRNFFVHLNWGTSCIGTGQALDGREEVERRLEEMVMGEGYDAWERGKVWRIDLRG